MPKMKTHKGLKKRFKITARGKCKHNKAGAAHLLSHKSGNRKRRLRHGKILNNVICKRIRVMLQQA